LPFQPIDAGRNFHVANKPTATHNPDMSGNLLGLIVQVETLKRLNIAGADEMQKEIATDCAGHTAFN
jgi:hypothetical protein